MIVPDVNLLVFAYHMQSPYHDGARGWWEGLVNGTETVGIPWAVTTGFVRLMANPRVLESPMSPSAALRRAMTWFQYAHIQPLNPGSDHLTNLQSFFDAVDGGVKLVPDAHIAALAIEHQAVVHSHDSDFRRFPGLQWHNPL
jgi:toxin-antitoxin system PIN domain toxin